MSCSTNTTVSATLPAISAKLASASRSFSEPIQYCNRRSMGASETSVQRHQAAALLSLVDVLLQRALRRAVQADDPAAQAHAAVVRAGGRDVVQHQPRVDHRLG